MKKVLALVLALIMVFALVACGKTDAPGGNSAAPGGNSAAPGGNDKVDDVRTIKIAVSMSVMDEGMTKLYGFMQDRAATYTDYKIELTYTNAEGSVDKQLSDIDALIAQEPDIIYVMCVDSDGVAPGIKAIKDAGILAAAGRAINTDLLDFLYVGFDQYSLGAVQADWLQAYLDANPGKTLNVGYIEGTSGQSSAAERFAGFKENFIDKNAGKGNVNLVVTGDGNYKTDVAQSLVEDWLIAYPEMNVIVCCNDEMAMGAVNAIKAAQRNDILVLGADGLDLSKELIREGSMAMTVFINVVNVGGGAIDKCVEAVLNNGSKSPIVNMGKANLSIWDSANLPN